MSAGIFVFARRCARLSGGARLIVCAAFLVAVPLCAAGKIDVLLAAAGEAELAPLRAKLTKVEEHSFKAWKCWSGELAGKSVVLARTDGDPLNAVAVTTLAIRQFQPKLVLVFGVARSHDPLLKPFDAVIAERFVAFDGFISSPRPLDGGVMLTEWKKLSHPLISAGEKETYTDAFPAKAPSGVMRERLLNPRGQIVFGVLGSAHQLNRETDRIAWLRATWGTSCEDFESAHVAGCARLFDVPVAGLRVICPPEARAEDLMAAQNLSAELAGAWVEASP